MGYKTYQNVLQLWEGSYLSRTAQSFYDWGVIAQYFEAMRLLGELQDTMKPLPSIDGQLSLMTAGAEERKPLLLLSLRRSSTLFSPVAAAFLRGKCESMSSSKRACLQRKTQIF